MDQTKCEISAILAGTKVEFDSKYSTKTIISRQKRGQIGQ
jgi:hypothetical protein